jgi:hypothetical protein
MSRRTEVRGNFSRLVISALLTPARWSFSDATGMNIRGARPTESLAVQSRLGEPGADSFTKQVVLELSEDRE